MNKQLKRIMATTLVMTLAFGGGATAALAKGNEWDRGKGNKGNGYAKGHDKRNYNGPHKFNLDLNNLHLDFKDVHMDWARQHIASLVAKGVFEGYTDGTFQPNKHVSRLEALVTAVRLMDLRDEAESDEKMSVDLHLKDEHAIDDWAIGYVAVALENDLFFETDDKLQPNKPADRLWVTTLLVKALGLEDEARAKMTTKLTFKDADAIPAGAVGYVAVAVERDIVKGYTNNTFRPNNPVTRAEIAAFLDRAGDHLPEYREGGILKSAIADNKLTLTDGTVYEVDDDAYVFHNEKRIDIDELRAGDRVTFITYNDVVIFVKVLDKADADAEVRTINGTLSSGVVNGNLRMYADGSLQTIAIDANADIYRNGKRATAAALKTGDTVQVRVKDGKAVRITVVERIEEKDYQYGTVVSVNAASGRLSVTIGDRTEQFEADQDAAVYRDDKRANLADLRAGDQVLLILDDEEVVYVHVTNQAQQATFSVQGTLGALSLNAEGKLATITLNRDNGQGAIYHVDANVKITGNASELVQGKSVRLNGSYGVVTEIVIL